MCIYHGWKFDVNGDCVDMPSDLPGSNFKDKVHVASYPCIESAGAIWTYMGPAENKPQVPSFVMNVLPEENVMATRTMIYCNYLQSIEGNLDSTHLGTLHLYYDNMIPADLEYDKPGHPSPRFSNYITGTQKYARIDVQDTDYGYRLIAVRKTPKGNQHIRINNLALPVMTWIASSGGNGAVFTQLPVDDHNCMRVGFIVRPDKPFTAGERQAAESQAALLQDPDNPKLRLKRMDNDYHQDRVAQKTTNLISLRRLIREHPWGICSAGTGTRFC